MISVEAEDVRFSRIGELRGTPDIVARQKVNEPSLARDLPIVSVV